MNYTNKIVPFIVIKEKFVPQLSEKDAVAHAHLLKALGDPTRLRILSLLSRHEGEMCVSEITECFTLTQPTISSHLRVLWTAGLIESRKKGLCIYYYVKREKLAHVKNILDELA